LIRCRRLSVARDQLSSISARSQKCLSATGLGAKEKELKANKQVAGWHTFKENICPLGSVTEQSPLGCISKDLSSYLQIVALICALFSGDMTVTLLHKVALNLIIGL